MYLLNCTRPDISLLSIFWQDLVRLLLEDIGMKLNMIFRYLQGTIDLGLFYPKNSKGQMIGYANACYFSDPHKVRS